MIALLCFVGTKLSFLLLLHRYDAFFFFAELFDGIELFVFFYQIDDRSRLVVLMRAPVLRCH